jgi:endonuclease G
MVSPSLFMTNNHVLPTPEDAAHSLIEFGYQDGLDGKPMPASVFDLDPSALFITSDSRRATRRRSRSTPDCSTTKNR